MTDIGYAREEHPWGALAIRYTSREVWVFSPQIKHWVPMHPVRPMHSGSILTENDFERLFPDLPPLPEGAFETPLTEPSYGHWEHVPIRFMNRRRGCSPSAQDAGSRSPFAEVEKGRSLTRQQFERMFADLPPLPGEAFQPMWPGAMIADLLVRRFSKLREPCRWR